MTAIEQSPSLDPERKWKRIIIWMVAALDLAALTILLWTWWAQPRQTRHRWSKND